MKKVVLILFWANLILAENLTLVDELDSLYPDSHINKELLEYSLDVPKESLTGVTVFMNGLPGKDMIRLKENKDNQLKVSSFYRLIDVPVEENTGLGSRTEIYEGKINPHVIRRAPFQIYEVLQPVTFPYFSELPQQAFRLEWQIDDTVKAGSYELSFTASGKEFSKEFSVTINVYDVAVPKAGKETFGYTNWFNIGNMANQYDCEMWSEQFWTVLQNYAKAMYKGRQNMFWIPFPAMFEKEDDTLVLQEKRLERYIKTFTDIGFYYIEISPISFRTDGNWGSKTLSSSIDKELLVNSSEGKKFHENLFKQLQKFVYKNGWKKRIRFHIADEPTDVLVDDYKLLTEHLRKYFPDVKIMEATMTLKLSGTVNIWVPQLQEFQKHQDFFEERKKEDGDVWIYSCLVPGGKWLNRLLDQSHLRQVYIGWSLPRFELGGFLHWGLNHYDKNKNPFTQSVRDHGAAPNTTNRLPAGDTHILYPGIDGPWSSIRFIAHAVGMEDAELFQILSKKENIKPLMDKCFRLFNDYDTDVQKYRKVRKELLNSLTK